MALFDIFRTKPASEQTRSFNDAHNWLPPMPLQLVSDQSALAVPAFWRAVNLKVDLIASLPLEALDGSQKLAEQPQILTQPDPTEDRMVTLTRLLSSLILKGNAFALLGDFDDYGYPRAIKVLPTEMVQVQRVNGKVVYSVNGEPVADHEILHLRGLTLPGDELGLSVIDVHRRSISTMNRVEEFTENFFLNNATPTAIIKNTSPEALSPDDMALIKAAWLRSQRGTREPVVMNKDLEFVPMAITAEDSQFLATKVHSAMEVALIVGVPPHFVGAQGSQMTYSNIAQESMNLAKVYLRRELVTLERAFSSLLPEGIEAKFNLDDLLRADQASRYDSYVKGLNGGFIQKDEIRQWENLGPLPDHLDSESIDPNILNSVVNLVNNGFDTQSVLKALNLPTMTYEKPEPVSTPVVPNQDEDEEVDDE